MNDGQTSRHFALARGKRNQILDSLSANTWLALELDVQPVDLVQGACLHATGTAPRHVYFPTTAVVSLVTEMRNGTSAEVATIGSEGVVGLFACMSDAVSHNTAVVQVPGRAWRMGVPSFVQHTWSSSDLMRAVLGFGHSLMVQVSQAAACNRHHGLEQRLSRWLLTMCARRPDGQVLITHERLAGLLGVRREGVTAAANRLQKEGLIGVARGRVHVLDPAGLQRRSCECAALMGPAYRSTDPAEGSASAGPAAGRPQPPSAGPARPAYGVEPRPVLSAHTG